MPKISVAITAYNSSRYILRAVNSVKNIKVDEIVIFDDCSDDYKILVKNVRYVNNVITVKGLWNVGPLHNKYKAINLCRNDWVILLDADNQLDDKYIDTIMNLKKWDKDTLYCPVYGHRSSIDYRAFKNLEIDRNNVKDYLKNKTFLKMMNTGMFFVNRYKYCEILKLFLNEDIPTLDVMFFILKWLQNNYKMRMVNRLGYIHHIGPRTNWKRNRARGKEIKKTLLEGFNNL